MRLKTLRKERPAFEIEGAIINGNRMDLSKSDIKPTKYRSNTAFALPTSLNIESSALNIPPSDQTHEIVTRSRPQIVIPTALQPSKLPSYQAIESAYLEHGVRIRLSPSRTGQQSGSKSASSLQRHSTGFTRNPSRTSSVLHYTVTNLDHHHGSRSFSALQQTSSNDFEQNHTHNVSLAQSFQIDEETQDDFLSPSIVASEHSNPISPPEKLPVTNGITSTAALFDNDPDLMYMSELLRKSSGDCFRDTIRRRAGLRGTFSVHRHSLTASSIQPQEPSRDKSPYMNRHFPTRPATSAVPLTPSFTKIDQDILKHASRIRRTSQSKDYVTKSPRRDSMPAASSLPSNNEKQNSTNKSFESMSLEPLKFLLSPTSCSASLPTQDLPTIKISFTSRRRKTPRKRSKSAKHVHIEKQNTTNLLSTDYTMPSTLGRPESLSLMKTSPLDMATQSNSFDSGWYDHSFSSGDVQSLTSSSVMQIPSSIPSARRTNSAARRLQTNKKVSFYEEPTAVILTTATYV